MVTSTSVFTLVSALAGSGAYIQERPVDAAASQIPLQVMVDIRRARVEIYCGHNALAVAVIRAAREQLRASGGAMPAETLAALDQAAWLTRHDQYALAQQALETALAHLP